MWPLCKKNVIKMILTLRRVEREGGLPVETEAVRGAGDVLCGVCVSVGARRLNEEAGRDGPVC